MCKAYQKHMKTSFDVIAVGMTHAYTAAKQGPRVLVVDTDHQAAGGQCQEFRIYHRDRPEGGVGLAICQTLGRDLALHGS